MAGPISNVVAVRSALQRKMRKTAMTKPRISVVTACFGNADHLESTLCSILDQGYSNLQLIVIDGSSEDHTTAKVRHYRQSIDLWVRQRCTSMAAAINVGLAKVDGDIVAVLEAGNIYLPGTLEHIAKNMNEQTPWFVGQCQRVDEFDCRLGTCMASTPASFISFLKHDSGMLPLASSFIARSVLESTGTMDETLQYAFDYDFNVRLLAAGYEPAIANHVFAARREPAVAVDGDRTLAQGQEYIQVALKHAQQLSAEQRKDLILNCDYRTRIYALAEAELRSEVTHSQVVQSLLEEQPATVSKNIGQFLDPKGHRSAPSLRQAM